MFGNSSNDLWAIGAQEGVGDTLAVHWDGKAWEKMPLPLPSGDSYGSYAGIAAVPGTPALFVVGQGRTGNDPASATYVQSILRYDTPPPPVNLSAPPTASSGG